jgi:hypothetical protein
MSMSRNIIVTTVLMLFTLLAVPSMSSADDQPIQADTDNPAIEVVHNDEIKKDEARSVYSKKSRSVERAEGIDCFYEENKSESDCSRTKSDQR